VACDLEFTHEKKNPFVNGKELSLSIKNMAAELFNRLTKKLKQINKQGKKNSKIFTVPNI
jgi:hypothetical protein